MAVYEQGYRPYAGPSSGRWTARTVIPRYALSQLFASRLFTIFFVLCFVYTLGHAAFLYVTHNLSLFTRLGFKPGQDFIDVGFGPRQMQIVLLVQMVHAFFLTLFAGPTLIARDLHNNGLALYLSRPLTRWSYIAGKFAVMALLLSAVTWVPALFLYSFNAVLEGGSWFVVHGRLALAAFAGSWIVIIVFALVALAASALLRARPMAMAATFGVLVVGAPFGAALNAALGTRAGDLFDVMRMIHVLWRPLFGEVLLPTQGDTSAAVALASVVLFAGAALAVLARKVKPYEVVR